MPAAPLERPAKHHVLHVLAATIAAGPAEVFAALDSRLAPRPDARPGSGAPLRYLADAGSGTIIVQGSWWYRAEYRVVAGERGSTIDHELVSVAQLGERAALIAGARTAADTPLAFHTLVRSIRLELE
ncbi:hypothetical protein [Marisediminicola sp. LYQ134]|uniref:hypothetical protein n=1 Tax=unclassified Marisediminicola TaxID=2618316 RepID=UPI003983728B